MPTFASWVTLLSMMRRDQTALVIAPALGSLFFGVGALVALPLMLVLGVPLFLLCRRHRWLQWWHAAFSAAHWVRSSLRLRIQRTWIHSEYKTGSTLRGSAPLRGCCFGGSGYSETMRIPTYRHRYLTRCFSSFLLSSQVFIFIGHSEKSSLQRDESSRCRRNRRPGRYQCVYRVALSYIRSSGMTRVLLR
jgi:hypothetical protein